MANKVDELIKRLEEAKAKIEQEFKQNQNNNNGSSDNIDFEVMKIDFGKVEGQGK